MCRAMMILIRAKAYPPAVLLQDCAIAHGSSTFNDVDVIRTKAKGLIVYVVMVGAL